LAFFEGRGTTSSSTSIGSTGRFSTLMVFDGETVR
jgi:hypothetical protein